MFILALREADIELEKLEEELNLEAASCARVENCKREFAARGGLDAGEISEWMSSTNTRQFIEIH